MSVHISDPVSISVGEIQKLGWEIMNLKQSLAKYPEQLDKCEQKTIEQLVK